MDAIKQAIEAGHISPEIGGPLADRVRAYITAALWSSTIETENRESSDYDKSFLDAGYSVDSLGFGELSAAIRDCLAFQKAAGDMLTGWTMEQAGHDFWLTRCGHGAGFWDRGLPYVTNWPRLSAFARLSTILIFTWEKMGKYTASNSPSLRCGDDSVAQLGGAHVALEGISNVAAKVIEDSRVGVAFLEKSTRYVRFDQKDAEGRWLFHPEERLVSSPHREAFLGLMDRLFAAYAAQIEPMLEGIRRLLPIEEVEVRHPKTGEALPWSDVARNEEFLKMAQRAYGATVRAHACDVMRGYLPGATRTNVGVFASGQAFEHLVTRLLSLPLAELNAGRSPGWPP